MRFQFLRAAFLLFLFTTAVHAQNFEKRVLFIVETSKDTKSLATAETKLVSALVGTGLGGLLETNDTFGIWTFNETLQVGRFPIQRWTPQTATMLASRTQAFLQQQPHEKSPKIETVWRPLETVIGNSPALMVVLVTSGKPVIKGTPFDAEINAQLKAASREYQKNKAPAVIMLSATSGKILRFSVSPAIGDVRIPVLNVPPKPVQKIAVTEPIRPKAPVEITAPAVAPKPNAALVITKEGAKTISRDEAETIEINDRPAPTPPVIKTETTPEPSPTKLAVIETKPSEKFEEPKPLSQPQPEIAPRVEPSSIPVEVQLPVVQPEAQPVPSPAEPIEKKFAVVAIAEEPQPTPVEPAPPVQESTALQAEKPTEQTIPSVQMAAQIPTEPSRSFPFLFLAIGLMFVAVLLAFLIGRHSSRRPQQSLVSDWADRDRTKK